MNEIFRELAALVHEQGEAIGKDCFHFTDFVTALYTQKTFLSRFPFANIHEAQNSRETGRPILALFYHFHPLNRHLGISRASTADSSIFFFLVTLFRVGFYARSLLYGG